MATRSFTYLYGGQRTLPIHNYRTSEKERLLRAWLLMQGIERIKVKNLDALLDELPPVSQELMRGAVAAFSDKPCDRPRHLFGHFAGKLHAKYSLNDRIALALSHWITSQKASALVTEHKRMVSKKVYGVDDPVGLAVDFCALLALRLSKVPFASPSNRHGYLRRVLPGLARVACR